MLQRRSNRGSPFLRHSFCFVRCQEESMSAPSDENKGPGSDQDQGNAIKHPDNWKTGDEPITGAQRSYLNTLAEEAGVDVDDEPTKAEASKKIDELQEQTGRGR